MPYQTSWSKNRFHAGLGTSGHRWSLRRPLSQSVPEAKKRFRFFRNLRDIQDVDDPKAFEPNLHSGFSLPASNPFQGYRASSQSQHPLCGGQGNMLQVVIPLHRLAHTHIYICGPCRLHSHLRTLRAALDSLEECLHLFKDTSLAVNTDWQGAHRETLTTPPFVSLLC